MYPKFKVLVILLFIAAVACVEKPIDAPLDSNAVITSCEIVNYTAGRDYFVPEALEIDAAGRSIVLYAIDNVFPLDIVSDLEITKTASFKDPSQAQAWHFTAYDQSIPVVIVAQDGTEYSWTVRLEALELSDREDLKPSFGQHYIDPDVVQFLDSKTDLANSKRVLSIKASQTMFPLVVRSLFIDSESLHIKGLKSGSAERLNDWDSEIVFYMVDPQSREARRWIMGVERVLETGNDIVDLDYEGCNSTSMNAVLGSVDIDPLEHTVSIEVLQGYDFPIDVVGLVFELSPSATAANIPTDLHFDTITSTHSIQIVSETGVSKTWTLKLMDNRPVSSEADVKIYRLTTWQGTSDTQNNMVFVPAAVIDPVLGSIVLRISDWGNKFPVTVSATMNISNGCSIVDANMGLQHQWTFNSLTESHSFTLRSQDGNTDRQWTVSLRNESPAKSSEAVILDFQSGAAPAGFTFAEKYLEKDKSLITLMLSQRPSASSVMNLAAFLVLSDGAKVENWSQGQSFAISCNTPATVYLRAQDDTRKAWTIRLMYAPQIYNNGFETWVAANGASTNLAPSDGTGWATGNNEYFQGTLPGAGFNSEKSCSMTTQLQRISKMGINVTSLTGAATLLGTFALSINTDYVYHPYKMTHFGIPFACENIPVAYEFDYKYHPGGQRIFTEPKWNSSLIPGFEDAVNISGGDKAYVYVDICNSSSSSYEMDITTFAGVLAQGYFLEAGEVSAWTHKVCTISPRAGAGTGAMTHLSVRMCPSYEADQFKGAPGSRLDVDNIHLIYYIPDSNAILLQ